MDVRLLARTDGNPPPPCSIGHRLLRIRCPKSGLGAINSLIIIYDNTGLSASEAIERAYGTSETGSQTGSQRASGTLEGFRCS